MQVNIEKTYETMSEKALDELLGKIRGVKNALVCTASGDSPKGLYNQLISSVKHNNADIKMWDFLSLDEWMGMNGNDEGSCRFHLNNDLFNPLNVTEDKITFFDGRAPEPAKECERIEKYIEQHNGIDVAIVGLGLNGHIGMNEPGSSVNSRCRIAAIDPVTQQSGQKYFKESRQLTRGLTLGIADIMEARHVMLVVSGSKKASIVKQVIEGEISTDVPASILRNHKSCTIWLDNDAAELLQKK